MSSFDSAVVSGFSYTNTLQEMLLFSVQQTGQFTKHQDTFVTSAHITFSSRLEKNRGGDAELQISGPGCGAPDC